MSDTILAGKLTVYYLAENRRKQIRWTGTTAKDDVQTMIDVYDATEDLFTQPTQQDDGLIFSAETPGEYTIGKIDAGDQEPWFIDLKTMEHMIGNFASFTGCALKTSGWARDLPGDGSGNIGIVVVAVDGSDSTIVPGDIGEDITHADLDAGTLLDVIIDPDNVTDYLWIRPDTNTLADDFNSTSGLLTEAGTSHTATQTAAAVSGEMVWGNFYTQGALANSDVHIFLYQDGERVVSSDENDQDWWVDDHVDRAIPVTDYTTADFPIIDLGYLTVKAGQYGSKYTYSIIRMNTTSGGNVAAGLSSGDDITNTTGYRSVTFSGDNYVAGWSVGDEMSGDTSNARGIITLITTPGSTQTVHYLLIGDPLTAFQADENVTNEDDNGTGDIDGSGPENQGPALTTWFDGNTQPTYTFTNTQFDVDDDATDEEYAVGIDVQQASLSQLHQYNKYAHRRGSVLDQDGLDGQEWIGLDYAINYASITGTVPEGSVLTGKVSGATAVLVSNPAGTTNTALVRNTRGTFQDAEAIYETDGVNEFDASGLTVEVIVPVAEASFGTLAGTTFFASRGVLLTNYKSGEENLWTTIDATGTVRARPTSISMTIGNLLQYDWASAFRLTGTGLPIDFEEYSATGGESIGDATITVDGAIAADVPGKALGGRLVLRDADDNDQDYVLRYTSYAAATGVVTLSNSVWTAEALTDDDTIIDTGAFSATEVGDLVYNNDLTAVSYVTAVVSNDEITIYPPLTGQDSGDTGEINCAPIVVDTADDVYFPIVLDFQTGAGSASASMVYVGNFFVIVRVRNTSSATTKIKGYTAEVEIGTGGGQATATRIENTVYGS